MAQEIILSLEDTEFARTEFAKEYPFLTQLELHAKIQEALNDPIARFVFINIFRANKFCKNVAKWSLK